MKQQKLSFSQPSKKKKSKRSKLVIDSEDESSQKEIKKQD